MCKYALQIEYEQNAKLARYEQNMNKMHNYFYPGLLIAGFLLSPLLYIMYTNMCQSQHENRTFIKFADDTVIVSLLNNSETSHGPVINEFVTWCDESFLELNTSKTKELIIDLRRRDGNPTKTLIKGETVECVDSYRYLGTVIDSKLTF